ncbi:hypothetical protein GGR51DRAFT_560397 [Nemania sp. FL0031]|nr:hypothetical protein GGR51DRAFT_560397 [Nemania sp. FL0031]
MSSARGAPRQATTVNLDNVGKTKIDEFGRNGGNWMNSFQNVTEDMKQQYNVSGYEIIGSKPHMSSTDPSDKKKVVTIGFFVENIRSISVHLHEDGTYKFWESRKGKKNKQRSRTVYRLGSHGSGSRDT